MQCDVKSRKKEIEKITDKMINMLKSNIFLTILGNIINYTLSLLLYSLFVNNTITFTVFIFSQTIISDCALYFCGRNI